jgi:hypothetical protein
MLSFAAWHLGAQVVEFCRPAAIAVANKLGCSQNSDIASASLQGRSVALKYYGAYACSSKPSIGALYRL